MSMRDVLREKVDSLRPPRRYNDTGADKAAQQVLVSLWSEQKLRCPEALPALDAVHLRAFSQNYEDGALLLLFALIGTTNRITVELCAGNGLECNSANLIVNHGWTGLLVDGDPDNVATGAQFYSTHADTWPHPPTMEQAWITRESVNDIVRGAGIEGEIDLLTIDLDGVDYWIWQALDCIDPRVVVVEYNDIAGPDRSITVPYTPNFVGDPLRDGFVGASLSAFTKLAKSKGYRLVGTERWGFNAFFVKDGLGEDLLPERPVEDFFTHPKVVHGMATRWPRVAHRPWQDV